MYTLPLLVITTCKHFGKSVFPVADSYLGAIVFFGKSNQPDVHGTPGPSLAGFAAAGFSSNFNQHALLDAL